MTTKVRWSMRFRNTSSKRSGRHCDGERGFALTRNGDNATAIRIPDFGTQRRPTSTYIVLQPMEYPRLPGFKHSFEHWPVDGMKLRHCWGYIGHQSKHPNGRGRTGKPRGGHLLPDGSREHRYLRDLAEEILRRLSMGQTLAEICADPAIPVSTGAVRQLDVDDRDGWFSAAYARARRQQVEAWSDELLKIADDPRLEPNDRRVRLETRKWLMSKLNPKRWGDKVTLAGDPEAPLQVVSRIEVARLSDPELDALERFTDARLVARDVRDHGE